MKVKLIGKGNSWTKNSLCTSYVINDEIILDAPQGSFKNIIKEIDINKIKSVIISHMHSDHWIDFHLLACEIIYNRDNLEKIKLFVPSNFELRLKQLCDIIETPQVYYDLLKKVDIIKLSDNKQIMIDDLFINAFDMIHSNMECYGFTISDKHKTVGFTCDTGMCENVDNIIKNSDLIFMDCSNVKQRGNNHLSIEIMEKYKKKYAEKKFIPIHQSDEVVDYLKSINESVKEGSVYDLENKDKENKTMRIGLDLDNVISDFDKIIFKEMLKEDKKKRNAGIINPNASYFTTGMFDWSDEEVVEFFANNMERMAKVLPVRKNCKSIIDKLIEDGHEIYIVSHRVAPDYKEPEKTTKDWLKNNKIKYTKLIISHGINKTVEYNELKLDVMFDDRDDACLQMRNDGANCIVMLTKFNENRPPENLPYVKDWNDLYRYIKNYKIDLEVYGK